MIRSLYNGASGMKAHQVRMDVISNNVANVNTTGFKASRVNFQDVLYQWSRYPSAADSDTGMGGINPSQVGLGVMVSSITNNTGQGPFQNTGRTLDLAVNGNGWFVLSTNGESVDSAEGNDDNDRYSRDGVFYVDNEGNLVNSEGYFVCDTSGEPIQLDIGDSGIASITVDKTGVISYTLLDGTVSDDKSRIGLAMFPNQEGLERDGLNLFKTTPASGYAVDGENDRYGDPAEGGYGTINSGFLEMSNVELTDEFVNMITTQRGYQANSRSVTTSDTMLEELLNTKR